MAWSSLHSRWTTLVLCGGLIGCTPAGPGRLSLDPSTVVVRGVHLLDPAHLDASRDKVDVLIQDGVIKGIFDVDTGPSGARSIDGTGRTLMPGLVDAHTHLGSPASVPGTMSLPDTTANLAGWASAGVTTIFDMGGRIGPNRELATKVDAGLIVGPRIHSAPLPLTARGGHPIPAAKALLPAMLSGLVEKLVIQVDGPDDAEAAVATAVAGGADYVKIIVDDLPGTSPKLDGPTVAALIAAAHTRGLKVAVHVGSPEDLRVALAGGADLLAHLPHSAPLSEADVELVVASGVPVVATLAGFQAAKTLSSGTWSPSPLDRQLGWGALSDALVADAAQTFAETPVLQALADSVHPGMAGSVAALAAAGAVVYVGSDAPLPASWPGSGLHHELDALRSAGIASNTLLSVVTTGPAVALGTGPARAPLGVGSPADLVLVDGDPQARFEDVHEVSVVWIGGRQVSAP